MQGEQLQRVLSFNYDRKESLLETYTPGELASLTGVGEKITIFEPGSISIERQMEGFTDGRQLWKIFLLTGLIFLALEVLLLRFMK